MKTMMLTKHDLTCLTATGTKFFYLEDCLKWLAKHNITFDKENLYSVLSKSCTTVWYKVKAEDIPEINLHMKNKFKIRRLGWVISLCFTRMNLKNKYFWYLSEVSIPKHSSFQHFLKKILSNNDTEFVSISDGNWYFFDDEHVFTKKKIYDLLENTYNNFINEFVSRSKFLSDDKLKEGRMMFQQAHEAMLNSKKNFSDLSSALMQQLTKRFEIMNE